MLLRLRRLSAAVCRRAAPKRSTESPPARIEFSLTGFSRSRSRLVGAIAQFRAIERGQPSTRSSFRRSLDFLRSHTYARADGSLGWIESRGSFRRAICNSISRSSTYADLARLEKRRARRQRRRRRAGESSTRPLGYATSPEIVRSE